MHLLGCNLSRCVPREHIILRLVSVSCHHHDIVVVDQDHLTVSLDECSRSLSTCKEALSTQRSATEASITVQSNALSKSIQDVQSFAQRHVDALTTAVQAIAGMCPCLATPIVLSCDSCHVMTLHLQTTNVYLQMSCASVQASSRSGPFLVPRREQELGQWFVAFALRAR